MNVSLGKNSKDPRGVCAGRLGVAVGDEWEHLKQVGSIRPGR